MGKYDRLKIYNETLYIVELGVAGDDKRKSDWIRDAKNSFSDFPLLKSILLFNSIDSEGVWGEEFTAPDWRINPAYIFSQI